MTYQETSADEEFAAETDKLADWQDVIANLADIDADLAHGDNRPLIVIASNRGPVSFDIEENGDMTYRRGSGGLVTALSALAEQHDVLWVAAASNDGDRAWAEQHNGHAHDIDGMRVQLVQPDPSSYQQYYNIISNPLLWFIQHQMWDIPRSPSINQETWQAWDEGYVAVNKQFAEAIAASVRDSDRPVIIFPQDYHLYLVPQYLRELLDDEVQIQPFIHIPWPGPDAWRILPDQMRLAILTSLLASNRIGFHTQRDAFNFVQCCRIYVPDAHSRGSRTKIHYNGREVEARDYPISIDVEQVEALAAEPYTQSLKMRLTNVIRDLKLILRVDRVEPSKNVLRGLEAYRSLLASHPEHLGKIQMQAQLFPSRMEVEEYQDYLQQVMAQAGMINAEFSDEEWEPVRVVVVENYQRALALMQIYDVLLVNPIADGMNLVAKEGALVNEHDGVLVLSEHAGAYFELGDHALTVSPFDVYGTAEAMHRALTMDADERRERAAALREQVMSADVRTWFYNQVEDALRAFSNQSRKSSTSDTPHSEMSAESLTILGVPNEITPNPNASQISS